MKSIIDFQKYKDDGKLISVITCYDYWSAKIIENTSIDAVLVGDSVAMVNHGFESTVNADLGMMQSHVSSVKKGIDSKVIIADLPFLLHRKGKRILMDSVETLVKAGANAVKIEGAKVSLDSIKDVVDSGIPVMGHIGLTPQSINQFGGYKVQGKNNKKAEELVGEAKLLEEAGVFAVVLELVPANLAKRITEEIHIPTIGIGAGRYTSGQVLVLNDMLGLNKDFNPKFLRKFMEGFELMKSAFNAYDSAVKTNSFPNDNESF